MVHFLVRVLTQVTMSTDIGPLLDVISNALNLKLVRVVVNQRLNTSLQGSDSVHMWLRLGPYAMSRFWKYSPIMLVFMCIRSCIVWTSPSMEGLMSQQSFLWCSLAILVPSKDDRDLLFYYGNSILRRDDARYTSAVNVSWSPPEVKCMYWEKWLSL